ncbi:RRQRL motif-containing zinc-binding protein [Streptomyces prunicolor]|uniref:RRQRL motif-containing zinc-binding protein n=1 Tax=Streptomyces prunicolor TaxID=67348 RepID=UPI00371E82A6
MRPHPGRSRSGPAADPDAQLGPGLPGAGDGRATSGRAGHPRCSRSTSAVQAAYLYRVDRAKPVRPMPSWKRGALALAMLGRRTCPKCHVIYGYCFPTSLGMCILCAYPDDQRAA